MKSSSENLSTSSSRGSNCISKIYRHVFYKFKQEKKLQYFYVKLCIMINLYQNYRFGLNTNAPIIYNYKCVGEYLNNRPQGNLRLVQNSTIPKCVGKQILLNVSVNLLSLVN